MKITRDFRPLSDRYSFDCGPCSYANGFAQIDTQPGCRATTAPGDRPVHKRTIVNFCEGDLTTDGVRDRRRVRRRSSASSPGGTTKRAYGPMKIDAVFHDALRQAFREARPRRPAALSAVSDAAAGLSSRHPIPSVREPPANV